MTVNSAKTIREDSFGSGPASGRALLQVDLTAVHDGKDAQGSSSFLNLEYVRADGKTSDPLNASTIVLAENEFDLMTTVNEGGEVMGDQILDGPAGSWEQGVLVVAPDILSDDTFVALD